MLDENLMYIMGSFMHREGYSNNQIEGNIWRFDEEKLQCVTCPIEEEWEADEDVSWDISGYQRDYELEDFSELEINSAFKVYVKKGAIYNVIISGSREDVDNVMLEKNGELLSLDFRGDLKRLIRRQREISIYIEMPTLTSVQLEGASKGYISGFDEDFLDISLGGAAYAEMDIKAASVDVVIEGASKLQLVGKGDRFDAEVHGASTLNAHDFIVNVSEVEAHNASTARVYASDNLTIHANGASSVIYRGDASVEIEKSGSSSVRKD
jgi:hypothetical protein